MELALEGEIGAPGAGRCRAGRTRTCIHARDTCRFRTEGCAAAWTWSESRPPRAPRPEPRVESTEQIGVSGERLTRDERSICFGARWPISPPVTPPFVPASSAPERATSSAATARASATATSPAILKDAHDNDVIDLAGVATTSKSRACQRPSPLPSSWPRRPSQCAAPVATAPCSAEWDPGASSGPRGRGGTSGSTAPDLLSIGVVGQSSASASVASGGHCCAGGHCPEISTPVVTATVTNISEPVSAARGPRQSVAKTNGARQRRRRPPLRPRQGCGGKVPAAKVAKGKVKAAPEPAAKKAAAAKKPRARKTAARSEA